MKQKTPLRLLRLPVLIYLGLMLFAWLRSERMIFLPPPPRYRDDEHILKLVTDEGTGISAMHLTNASARFTILFSHGNAEDLGTVCYDLERLRQAGFNVLGYDYPGYGTSGGQPTERGACRAIDAAYRHLTDTLRIDAANIVLFGRSVGSGPSVDLASRKPVGGLIVQSGFTSTFRVMTHWKILPFDRFDNLAKLPAVKCPVLILHGDADRVIPPWHGQALFAAASEPKQLVVIPGADHNDFNEVAGEKLYDAIRTFTSRLASGL